MNQSLLTPFGDAQQRVETAITALAQGQGVVLVDDEDRENEGDLIYAAETLTVPQMAMMIREGTGIVCLALPHSRLQQLELPPMVQHNTCVNGTAFTVSIEAKEGVSTGVSAADRVTTIQTAIADGCQPEDLARPGHVYPLRAREGGVLNRRGHTEGAVDLVAMAGLKPAGVLCELMHADGTMMRLPALVEFAVQRSMPVLTIEDIVRYRLNPPASLSA